MESQFLLFFIMAPTIVLKKVSCSCTVPAAFNGMKSDTLSPSPVNFADSNNIIWEVSIYGETFLWKCEDTGPDLLFLRSKDQVSSFPTPYFFYACIQFKTVSDTTLYYYLLNAKNAQSKLNARLKESTNGSLEMCGVCKQSAVGSNDFNVMSSTGTADKSAISNPSLGTDPCASTATETTTTTLTTTAFSETIQSCRSTQDNTACSFEGLSKALQKEHKMDKSNVCISSCQTTNMNNNLKKGIIGMRMQNIGIRGKGDTANVYFFVCIFFKQTPTSFNMYYLTDKGSNETFRYVESTKSDLTLCEICDLKIIPDNLEWESIQTDGTSSVFVNSTGDTDLRNLGRQCSSRSSSQKLSLIVVAVSVTVSLVLIGLA